MILVTGGAGYIGSHFVRQYLNAHPDQKILVVDNLSTGHREALDFSPNIVFECLDIGDIPRMVDLLRKHQVETVIHFAASCYVEESQQRPEKYFRNNCIQTLNLFEAMQTAGVKQLVFSSTCATYGNPEYIPLDEHHAQKPINVYGLTKLMIEQALSGYGMTQGWSYVILRYFNACGADESGLIGELHEPETHLIPLVLQTAAGLRKDIKVYGTDYETPDGTCVRDYIHINDLAQAHLSAIRYLRQHPGGEVFNLGTTNGTSVLDIIKTCESVTGKTIPVDYQKRRAGDPPMLVANADKAEKLLGWKPRYSLADIIKTAWDWELGPKYSHQDLDTRLPEQVRV